jgi:hypothetical protein
LTLLSVMMMFLAKARKYSTEVIICIRLSFCHKTGA